jgi:hypothetical protein
MLIVTNKPFLLSVIMLNVIMLSGVKPMFANKGEAYQSKAPFRCSTLGLAPGLNHKLGQKDLPRTNTLAYYKHSLITDIKKFKTLGPLLSNVRN